MVLSKKTKCQGCAALINKGVKYECSLKFELDYDIDGKGKAFGPKPLEKCYKPKDGAQLRNATTRKSNFDIRQEKIDEQ